MKINLPKRYNKQEIVNSIKAIDSTATITFCEGYTQNPPEDPCGLNPELYPTIKVPESIEIVAAISQAQIEEIIYWHNPEVSDQEIAELKRLENSRLNAYREESDPLYFKEQRGEVPEGTWEQKVAEIRARYPYPGE